MPRVHSWHVPDGMRPMQPGRDARADPMARLAVPVSTASREPAGAAASAAAAVPQTGTGHAASGRDRRRTH